MASSGAVRVNLMAKVSSSFSRRVVEWRGRSLMQSLCSCRPASSVSASSHAEVAGVEEEEFRVLEIPGFNTNEADRNARPRRKPFAKKDVPPPRYKTMPTDQDWSSVWPTAQTFNYSAVPLPIRQGAVFGQENLGISPAKYANAELMKIPNFLHLTPNHIKTQCAAIKKFCTMWPEGLETDADCEHHFPITVSSSDYLFDGSSIREPSARRVTLKVRLASLDLDEHAKDKLLRLVKDKYDKGTDTLTIVTDRCPLRKQNTDYAMYILTALNFESRKVEPWESEKTIADMEKYVWDIMPSKQSLLSTLEMLKKNAASASDGPAYLQNIPDDVSPADLDKVEEIMEYKNAVSDLHNKGENLDSLDAYKKSVKKLLLTKEI